MLEYGTARSDHAEIAEAVAACSDGFADPTAWSASTRAVLLFELDDTLNHTISQYQPTPTLGRVPPLTSFQRAAILFSDKLSRDRLAFRYEQEHSQNLAMWFQVATAVLGGLATFLIGVRALVDKENAYVAWFSAAAIACSAAGTVAASLSTFGDYQTNQLRYSRALAQLQQLHWRVASDVVKAPLLCTGNDENVSEKTDIVNTWRDRYEAIRDTAAETLARPGDLATSSPKAPPAPNQKPPNTAANNDGNKPSKDKPVVDPKAAEKHAATHPTGRKVADVDP